MPASPSPSPILIDVVSKSDFWDSPFFISVLTLGGVIVGAIIGGFFSAAQDNRKAKRESHERYLDKQLEYCSVILDQAKNVRRHLNSGIWPKEKPRSGLGSDAVRKAREEMRGSTDQALRALASLSLISPETIRAPARTLLGNMLYARMLEVSSDAKDAAARLSDSVQEFEVIGRKHFGVSEEALPKPDDRKKHGRSKLSQFLSALAARV